MAQQWKAVEGAAKNDSGEYQALVGGKWQPVAGAAKNDAGEYMALMDDAPPGLIDRATAAVKSGLSAVNSAFSPPTSVMDGYVDDRQSKSAANPSLGQSGLSQAGYDHAVSIARTGSVPEQDGGIVSRAVNVASGDTRAMEGRQAVDAAADQIKAEQQAQTEQDKAFRTEHPIMSGFASGAAQLAGSVADAPQFANDTIKEVAINPFMRLFGQEPMNPTERFAIAKDLENTSNALRPDIANKKLSELKGAGDYTDWIAAQAAIQAPQIVGSTGAAFIPKLRAAYLGMMGVTSGALQYQQDLEKNVTQRRAWLDGVTNGAFEALGEALPFAAFDKIGALVMRMPASQRAPFIAEAVKKTLAATGAMVGQHASEGVSEAFTQAGQNASQNYIAEIPTGLMDNVPEAGAIGAIMATPMSLSHGYHAARQPQSAGAALGNSLQSEVDSGKFDQRAITEDALRALSPTGKLPTPLTAKAAEASARQKSIVTGQPHQVIEHPAEAGKFTAVPAAVAQEVEQKAAAIQPEIPAEDAAMLQQAEEFGQAAAPVDHFANGVTPEALDSLFAESRAKAAAKVAQPIASPVVPIQENTPVPVTQYDTPAVSDNLTDIIPANPIDTAAHDAATSPLNDLPEPTQAQKEAGNYKKAHIKLHGLDIAIENPKGSERSGIDPNGEAWSVALPDHYGYIKRTSGADGEHVDTYIGNNPESLHVFVVDQVNADSGKFDEHKIMLGFNSVEDAMRSYQAAFNDGRGHARIGSITPMTVDAFKTWLKEGETKQPAAPQVFGGDKNGTSNVATPARLDTSAAKGTSADATGSDTNGVLRHDAATEAGWNGMPGAPAAIDAASGVVSASGNDAVAPDVTAAIRANVEKLVKRRAVAQQIKRGDYFGAALQEAKNAMSGKNVSAEKMRKHAIAFASDAKLADAFNGIADVLEVSRQAKQPAQKKIQRASHDLLQRIKQLGGIDGTLALDITGEKRAPGGWKFAFKKGGTGLDDLATMLADDGFMIDTSDVDGGVQQLRDMDAMAQRANELGINWRNLSAQQLSDAVYEAEDALEMARLDDELAMDDAEREAFSELAVDETVTDDELDIPFGDNVPVDIAAMDAHFNYGANNEESNDGQADGTTGRESAQGAERSAPTGATPQAGQGEVLQSYTNQEVLDAEARREQAGREEHAQILRDAAAHGAIDQADIDERTTARVSNSDNFQFGESSKQAAAPVADLFNQPAKPAAASNTADDRVVDLFGNGSRVQYFDDKHGTFVEGQKYPSGNTKWRAGEVIDGENYWLSDKEFALKADALASIRTQKAANTRNGKYAAKYGAIPSIWKGDALNAAKAIIDAGVSIDRFSGSTQTTSKYIYTENGVKVRMADHNLPSNYEGADVDYRYGGDINKLAGNVAEAEKNAASSINSNLVGIPAGGTQERSAVRADESGSLTELAQKGEASGKSNVAQLNAESKPADTAQAKKLEVLKAQAQGKISGDQGAALKELADAGEHAAVDEVLKPAKSEAKEPWQMTSAEWNDTKNNDRAETFGPAGKRNGAAETIARIQRKERLDYGVKSVEQERVTHRQVIEKALTEGRPVPNEVLADYPDLKPSQPAQAEQPSSGERHNTSDAGAELTYNKRNRMTRGIKWEDIQDKNESLRVKEVTKAKVYPKPDYDAIIAANALGDEQLNKIAAHLVKQVYDSISAKPQTRTATDEQLQEYITGVNRVMDGVMSWANNREQVADLIRKVSSRAQNMRGGMMSISALAEQAPKALLEMVYPNGYKAYGKELQLIGGNKPYGALQPGVDSTIKAMKDIEKGWPAAQESWQRQGFAITPKENVEFSFYDDTRTDGTPYSALNYRAKGQRSGYKTLTGATIAEARATAEEYRDSIGDFVLTKKNGDILGSYATEEEATEAARAAVKREAKTDQISEKGWSVAAAERIGVARRMEGENITSDKLKETFGFKGVNFGNWMKGETKSNVAERQAHLNHAYDAFLDLADIVGVPPKAMSLNGMLGLAIGAQGSGKNLAHFVPGVNEINLTRTGGAGALAHEWAHALDHYFATLAGFGREENPYLTEKVGRGDDSGYTNRIVDGKSVKVKAFSEELRPEVLDQFKAIVQAMTKKMSVAPTEEEAKAQTESRIAREEKNVESWLKAIRRDFDSANKEGKGNATFVMEQFDALASRVRNLDVGDGLIAASSSKSLYPVIAEMRDAYKKATGRMYSLDQAYGLYLNVQSLKHLKDGKYANAEHVPRLINSDYQNASLRADKETQRNYWATKLEMFARAFDAYVVDTLAEKAAKNSYLSGIEAVAPAGEERKTIGRAFDFLLAELKTKETDKGVAMFSRKDVGEEASQGGMLVSSVKSISNPIASKLKNIRTVKVVQSQNDIPGIKEEIDKAFSKFQNERTAANLDRYLNVAKNDIEGAYANGELYLVASNLRSAERVHEVLRHEVAHLSVKQMLEEVKPGLYKSFVTNIKLMDKAGNKYIRELAKAVDKTQPGLNADRRAEEIIAQIAERGDHERDMPNAVRSLWQRMMDGIKAFYKLVFGEQITDQDARDIVAQSFRWARGEEEAVRVIGGMDNAVQASRGKQSAESFARMALEELTSENDSVFAYKKTSSKSIDGAILDVVDGAEFMGEDTRQDERTESHADHRYVFKALNGKPFYVYETDAGEVWIDVSRLETGSGGGAIYAAIGNYAFNTGKRFIGDPFGLSPEAVIRRTHHMLSSALRFSTTRHLDAAKQQVWGMPEDGVEPLDWRGSDIDKVEAMIHTITKTAEEIAPSIKDFHYDFQSSQFKDKTGTVVSGADIARLVQERDGGNAEDLGIGTKTARRVTVLRSLLAADSKGASGGRSGILEQLLHWSDSSIPENLEGLFSRSSSKDVLHGDREGDAGTSSAALTSSGAPLSSRAPSGTAPLNLNTIAAQPANSSIPEETEFQTRQRQVQDKMNRFKVLQAWLNHKGVKLTDKANVHEVENLMHAKIANQTQDFRDQVEAPLLERAAKAGVTLEQIADYLEAQHIPEANARMRDIHQDVTATANGISDAEANATLSQFQSMPKFAEFKTLADEFRAIGDETLDIRLREGLISREQYDAYKATFKHWVPLRGDGKKPGVGKGLSVNAKDKRRLGHGERENGEYIIENLLMDRERAIYQVEHNRVVKSIIQFALEAKEPGMITVGKPEKRQVLKNQSVFEVQYKGKMMRAFSSENDAKAFINQAIALSSQNNGGGMARSNFSIDKTSDPIVVMQASPMLAENEIQGYVAGHTIRIQLNDELLARAATNMGVDQLNMLLSAARTINNGLSKIYTAYSPDFIFRNATRDFIAGTINLTGDMGVKMAGKIYLNYGKAAKELFIARNDPRKSAWVQKYRASGGNTGAAYLSDIERVGNDARAAMYERMKALDVYRTVYGKLIAEGRGQVYAHASAAMRSGISKFGAIPVVGHFLTMIEHLNAVTENALRLATYMTLVQNGYTEQKAASAAKNSTVNFNRKGEISNVAGSLYLFFNPSVQGSSRMFGSLLTSEHKGQAQAMAGMLAFAAFALAELGRGGDDDDERKWKNIPDYVKDHNMILKFGDLQWTIPVPYEFAPFHVLGNSISDAVHGESGWKSAIKVLKSIVDNTTPLGDPFTGDGKDGANLFQMTPTLVKMALAPHENENSFGAPIQPEKASYSKNKPDSQNMFRNTKGTLYSGAAEWMNEVTGGSKYQPGGVDVSPETLKFWVSSLTGGTGRFVTDSIGAAYGATEGVAPDLRSTPIARVFVREPSVADARSRFWEAANEAKQAADAFALAKKGHDGSAMKEIRDSDNDLIQLSRFADRMGKAAAKKRDLIDQIRMDDQMPLAQKREQMKEIEQKEQEYYDRFLKVFDQKQKARKDKAA